MQYNIFQNDFYDDPPGLLWAYRLTVILGDTGTEILTLTKSVKEVQLPDFLLMTYPVHFGGMKFMIPTRYKNSGSFTARFYDDKNLKIFKILRSLFRRTFDERDTKYEIDGVEYDWKYSDLSEDLTIRIDILDPRSINHRDTRLNVVRNQIDGTIYNEMKIVASYFFNECFVDKIDDLDLDYSSEDCVEWGLQIYFNDVTDEYANKEKAKLDSLSYPKSVVQIPNTSEDIEPTKTISSFTSKKRSEAKDSQTVQASDETVASAYEYARRILDQEKAAAKLERETAVSKARREADQDGMLSTGDYVTAAERERAVEKILEPEVQSLVEEHQVDKFASIGIDLNQSASVVKKQAAAAVMAAVAEGGATGYDLPSWDVVQKVMDKKSDYDRDVSELVKWENAAVREGFRDSDAVEMNMTSSTNKWYSERQTDEQKKEHLDTRTAKVKEAYEIIDRYENKREEIREDLSKNRKLYTGGKFTGDADRAYKTFVENAEHYKKQMDENDAAIMEAQKRLKDLNGDK